jgi:hypothetical protein
MMREPGSSGGRSPVAMVAACPLAGRRGPHAARVGSQRLKRLAAMAAGRAIVRFDGPAKGLADAFAVALDRPPGKP